jgi:Zn finger protein HypA/HybF involved in hydrogenase expression
MHEMSLALEVCAIAERSVPPDLVEAVTAVRVEVGDDAGVEAENLAFWLETLLTSPPFKAAIPKITRVPGCQLSVTHVEVEDGCSDD